MSLRGGIALYVGLVVLAAALFTLAPGTDLSIERLFYDGGFHLGEGAVLRVLYHLVFYVTDALAILLPLLLIAALWSRRPIFGIDHRAAIFLIVALAIGPGLVVNSALKDHWGRARPSQLVEFGGAKQFTPALQPSDQCDRNCSFPAGHPAIGFYFLSFALLIPVARRRRIVMASAIGAGAVLGLMRMAQGGHFLSDVVFSGLIVFGVSWLAWDLLVRRGGIGALAGWRRMLAIFLVCLAVGAVSFVLYDRPVAIYAHGLNPRINHVFGFITKFGYSDGWLIGCAIVFVFCFFIMRRLRIMAWGAAFVFANVAVSGLVVDLIKVFFGRARPKLWFSEHLFGFTWFGGKSDLWSFPSGHAATATALALSLSSIWPRAWPIWWLGGGLIMLSRLVIGAHYPSDLLGGFYVALLTWWVAHAVFDRFRLPIRESL